MKQQRKSFAGNKDVFSLEELKPILDENGNPRVKTLSSRAKVALSSNNIEKASGFSKLMTSFQTSIKDQWRRITESQCDPFVRVELRPGMSFCFFLFFFDLFVCG